MDALMKRQAHADAILQQVARVLNHRSFARSRSPARILRALGERVLLTGRAPASQMDLARILDLPADFDPTSNPLVRIHMSKLRRMLARYAEGDGRHDPVVLAIPRNAYRLEGFINGTSESSRAGDVSMAGAGKVDGRAIVLVSEFSAADDSLGTLTRYIALWLVPHLLDLEGIAAIGPLFRESDGSGVATRAMVMRRSRCAFVIEGDCRVGGRGIEIVIRVVDVDDGRVCWTDWLDEPAVADADGYEPMAKMIAARIKNKIASCRAAVTWNHRPSDGAEESAGSVGTPLQRFHGSGTAVAEN